MYVNHLASLHVFIIYFLMEKSSRFCSVTALRAYNTFDKQFSQLIRLDVENILTSAAITEWNVRKKKVEIFVE